MHWSDPSLSSLFPSLVLKKKESKQNIDRQKTWMRESLGALDEILGIFFFLFLDFFCTMREPIKQKARQGWKDEENQCLSTFSDL